MQRGDSQHHTLWHAPHTAARRCSCRGNEDVPSLLSNSEHALTLSPEFVWYEITCRLTLKTTLETQDTVKVKRTGVGPHGAPGCENLRKRFCEVMQVDAVKGRLQTSESPLNLPAALPPAPQTTPLGVSCFSLAVFLPGLILMQPPPKPPPSPSAGSVTAGAVFPAS